MGVVVLDEFFLILKDQFELINYDQWSNGK